MRMFRLLTQNVFDGFLRLTLFSVVAMLLGHQSFGANNLFLQSLGVVRNGATSVGCESPTNRFSISISSVCQAPPVVLSVSAFSLFPSQFSFTVTDPDGENVTLLPGDTPDERRFLATKVRVYSVTVVDLISGETAICQGGIRACKSKTQQEWRTSA